MKTTRIIMGKKRRKWSHTGQLKRFSNCYYRVYNDIVQREVSMLRFKIPPDTVFQAILRKSIDYAIDVLSDLLQVSDHDAAGTKQELMSLFPEIARVFPPSVARAALLNLHKCLDRPELYDCTDYHYLLLYDVLCFYADIHNGLVIKSRNKKEKKEASFVDPFYIEKINVNELIDLYFFNHVFLIDSESLLNLPESFRKTLRPEVFGLSQGLLPHPEELELKIDTHTDLDRYKITRSEFFGPKSKEYPDYNYSIKV